MAQTMVSQASMTKCHEKPLASFQAAMKLGWRLPGEAPELMARTPPR
jgi:hypothetical protein